MYSGSNMFALIVLALFATASANVYLDSKCPDVKLVDNFNFSSYGSGKWYEVARYPNSAEKDADCGYGEYTPQGDTFLTNNVFVRNNKKISLNGVVRMAEDAGNAGKLIVSLAGKSGKTIDSVLNVLYTDYDNYAIAYFCKYNEEKKSRQDFAWILSRSKSIDADLKSKLENLVKESKVLKNENFIWPSFSEEACNAA